MSRLASFADTQDQVANEGSLRRASGERCYEQSPGKVAPSEREDTISLLVADDERAVVEVLEALIHGESDLRLVGSARDAEGRSRSP